MSPSFGEKRKASKFINNQASKDMLRGDSWYIDRSSVTEYFGVYAPLQREIIDYLGRLSKSNREQTESVYLDLCGRTSGREFGFDKSYNFALLGFDATDVDRTFEGNIFDGKDIRFMVRKLLKLKNRPDFIVFDPLAGLDKYSKFRDNELPIDPEKMHEITIGVLRHRFELIVGKLLNENGYALISTPYRRHANGNENINLKYEEFCTQLDEYIVDFCKRNGYALLKVPSLSGGRHKFFIKKAPRFLEPTNFEVTKGYNFQ